MPWLRLACCAFGLIHDAVRITRDVEQRRIRGTGEPRAGEPQIVRHRGDRFAPRPPLMAASAHRARVALIRPAHQRPRHKGQLTWPPNWKINRSKVVTRMQCAFAAAAMTALATSETTRAETVARPGASRGE